MILKKILLQKISIFFVSILATFALISSVHAFDGAGAGTLLDPYQISSCTELQSINNLTDIDGQYFELTGNIDCSDTINWNGGLGFEPIIYFDGVFDGQGYTISDLYINRTSSDTSVGLFDSIGGFIFNLDLAEGVVGSVTGSAETFSQTGSLAGRLENGGVVIGVTSNVPVTGNFAGGLVGLINYGEIKRSSYLGTVTGSGMGNIAGGITASLAYGGAFDDLYVDADVSGAEAGGLVGRYESVSFSSLSMNRSYARGTVTASVAGGGLVGVMGQFEGQAINDSFSAVTLAGTGTLGGVVGTENTGSGTISNTYFDEFIAGTSNCMGSNDTVVTTTCLSWDSESSPNYLKNTSTDAPVDTWDFDEVWSVEAEFPSLRPVGEFDVPSEVSNVAVTFDELNGEYYFTWDESVPENGLSVTSYQYQMQIAGGDWSEIVDGGSTSGTEANFFDYYIGFDYEFRVRAENVYGLGDWVSIPFSAEAQNEHDISSCSELMAIDEIAGGQRDIYRLTQDIDCAGVEFDPIGLTGEWNSFGGVFDGQGYTISNLVIDVGGNDFVGLFSDVAFAVIQDVTIEDGSVNGGTFVGALAGYTQNVLISDVSVDLDITGSGQSIGGLIGEMSIDDGSSSIIRSRSLGSVTVTEEEYAVGGLLGKVDVDEEGTITISESYASGDVVGYWYVGGLIGEVYALGDGGNGAFIIIRDSYATGNVTGSGESIGGLIGYAEPEDDGDPAGITITNTYASGNVTGSESIGGLIGELYDPSDQQDEYVVVQYSFATGAVSGEGDASLVGGIFGTSDDDGGLLVDGLFWDVNLSGVSNCDGDEDVSEPECVGITEEGYFTNEDNAPFAGNWDTEEVWYFNGAEYPILRAFMSVDSEPEPQVTPRRTSSNSSNASGSASSAYLAARGITLAKSAQSETSTPSSVELATNLCPAGQIITQNLRAPSRNGVYNSYTGGIVTEIKILQEHLNRLGFNSGPVDGIAGPLTDGAIKRMQTFLGTTPDGYVGPITRGLLNNSCGTGGLSV